MTLWILFAGMIGVTADCLLLPLMRRTPGAKRSRLTLIALFAIVVVLPAGSMLLYNYLGSPAP
jgi:hypothetical protein